MPIKFKRKRGEMLFDLGCEVKEMRFHFTGAGGTQSGDLFVPKGQYPDLNGTVGLFLMFLPKLVAINVWGDDFHIGTFINAHKVGWQWEERPASAAPLAHPDFVEWLQNIVPPKMEGRDYGQMARDLFEAGNLAKDNKLN